MDLEATSRNVDPRRAVTDGKMNTAIATWSFNANFQCRTILHSSVLTFLA